MPPLVFREFHQFSLKFHTKNMKSKVILNVLPPQFLRRPLGFREVVKPLAFEFLFTLAQYSVECLC